MRVWHVCAVLVLCSPAFAQAAPGERALSGPAAASGPWQVLNRGCLSDSRCEWLAPSKTPARGVCLDAVMPGEAGAGVVLADSITGPPRGLGRWHEFTHLLLSAYVPPDAPSGVRFMVYLRDADLNYFQYVRAAALPSGAWTDIEIDLTDRSRDWAPVGHYMPWDGYCRQDVQELGVKFLCDAPYNGPLFVDDVRLVQRAESLPERNVIYNLRANGTEIGRYERFELSFNLARTYNNPFDPEEIDVTAVITQPDGTVVRVPGFFYQGFLRRKERGAQVLVPMGRSQWKVRFAPRHVGIYRYVIEIEDGDSLRSDPGEFQCVESGKRGFVRRSAKDPDYFEFDDGTFYYPIGHNIAATFDERARVLGVNIPASEGTYAFDRFLERMSAAGENFGRVWMTPWSYGIEWTKAYDVHFKGLGRYNMDRAWCVDHLLETAEKNGVYIMLLLTSHGEVGETESDFQGGQRGEQGQGSPYWRERGGPLAQAVDIYTSDEAFRYYKRKVRYVAARWGYATSIAAWEVLNEPDLSFYRSPQPQGDLLGRRMADFVRKVFAEIKAYDPSDHLTTSNVWQPTAPYAHYALQLPDMDFCAPHVFGPDMNLQLASLRRYVKAQYNQILLVTECDVTPHAQDPNLTARVMHQTIWTSLTLPMGGTACPWWWVLIDRKDLYGEFGAAAAFAKGEDRRGMGYDSVAALATDKDRRRRLQSQCLRAMAPGVPFRALCWIWAPDYFTQRSIGEDDPPAAAAMRIPNIPDGRYTVEMWDTHRGVTTATFEATAAGGALVFDVPAFVGDTACKIWPAPVTGS